MLTLLWVQRAYRRVHSQPAAAHKGGTAGNGSRRGGRRTPIERAPEHDPCREKGTVVNELHNYLYIIKVSFYKFKYRYYDNWLFA